MGLLGVRVKSGGGSEDSKEFGVCKNLVGEATRKDLDLHSGGWYG